MKIDSFRSKTQSLFSRLTPSQWFEITLVILIIGIHLYGAFSAKHNFSTRWFTRDDAYYYFKVAQNISEGKGSTFDGINPTNGYHPLWLTLCVPLFSLARFDLILPLRILMVIMAGLSAATAILLHRILRRSGIGAPVAMLAAAYWGLDMRIHAIITQQGMETGILAFSIALFIYNLQKYEHRWRNHQATRQDLVWLSLTASLMLFSRLDTIYLVLLAGIWLVFRGQPLRTLFGFDLLAAASIIVLAYVQRAGLTIYQQEFSTSALLMIAACITAQSLVFYFTGLYQHPRKIAPLRLLGLSILATGASTLAGGAILLGLSQAGLAQMPRAVPFIYFGGMTLFVFLLRMAYRALSPWPEPRQKAASPLEELQARWQTWLGDALAYYLPVGGLLGLYMLLNRGLFGTFMPVSGQIKRWWGSLSYHVYGGSAKTELDIFGLDPIYSQPWKLLIRPLNNLAYFISNQPDEFPLIPYWGIALATLTIFLALLLANRPKTALTLQNSAILLLFFSAQLHAFFYGAVPYAARHEWYWVLQMITLVLLVALAGQRLLELLPRIQVAGWLLSGGISLWLAFHFSTTIIQRMPYQNPHEGEAYIDMLPLLEQNTEPGAIIGMTGGGNVGYYIQGRTIVNMDGLINSYAYFQSLQKNEGDEYLAAMGLDYVFANPDILTGSLPYRPQFIHRLESLPGSPSYGRKEVLRFIR